MLLKFVSNCKLTDNFMDLFEKIKNNDKIIISDSNSEFINSILK
jgi:hypothetical protein